MIFTALSLVVMVFFGTLFDDFSRSLISLIFAAVFLFVLEHYFSKGWNHFLVLSISSMIPYAFWMVLDQWDRPDERYDIFTLLKILPLVAIVTIGLDFMFRFVRNREADLRPPPYRRRLPPTQLRGRAVRRLT